SLALVIVPPRPEELYPDERRGWDDEHAQRDPQVEPLPGEVLGRVDPERLLEAAERRVEGDVEREERGPADPEAPVDPEQHADHGHVPDELVQEGRVERLRVEIARRPVRRIDLQAPRERGRLAEELLVPPVAEPADPLREQESGRDRVQHQRDAVPGTLHDPGARQHAACDPAPDAEAALPDRERAPPRVRDLAPARDVVVEARADDPAGDAPDRAAEDQIPVSAPAHPADAGQPR